VSSEHPSCWWSRLQLLIVDARHHDHLHRAGLSAPAHCLSPELPASPRVRAESTHVQPTARQASMKQPS
jgi:hypothetical protein